MNQESPDICPECGKAMPAGSSHQLCHACLLAQALASRTIAGENEKSSAIPPPAPEEIADRFPQFEITECLGRGGMGVVYKARQKSLDRWVALKILAPERVGQEKFAERFAREAQTLARLNHPNIVGVFDYGETGGLYYFVMEFVDGVNLRDLLREGRLEAKQALAIVPPICDALQYAHEKGIVHRDIKPENLLLDREGRVKIADFGIAALVGAEGEPAGTPPYMAPEQTDARREVDHRADIYALGVVLYEMLTGERPDREAIAPSRKVRIDVRLDEIVLRALEKNPERRYEQASMFKTQVETIAGARSSLPSPQDFPNQWQPVIALLAMVACLVLFIMGFALPPPINLMPLVIAPIGFIVAALKLAGFWPWRSPLFPQSNWTGRNLQTDKAGGSSRESRDGEARIEKSEKPSRFSHMAGLAFYLLAYFGLLLLLATTAGALPSRVASHFGAEGRANGWMNREVYLAFVACLPLLFGGFAVVISWLVRWLPARFVSLPRGDFWLAPERRLEVAAFLCQRMFWLASLMTGFFAGLHLLTVHASRSVPPRLSMDGLLALVMAFLIAVLVWTVLLVMRLAEVDRPLTDQSRGGGLETARAEGNPASQTEIVLRQVKAPAFGLIASGVLQLLVCLALIVFAIPAVGREGGDVGGYVAVCFMAGLSFLAAMVVLSGAAVMLRLRRYRLAVTASVVAMIAGPAAILGLPFGIRALRILNRREVWEVFARGHRRAESRAPFLAKCALVLFLAGLILPPVLATFARNEGSVLLVGAVCGVASFALGLLAWKSLPGRIAAIGVPIVALVLTSLVLVRKEQARRLAALAEQHARDAALQAKVAHEPPKLQYLAWQDEVQTNPRWQAWTPTGELVRHEDLHLPTGVAIPSETDVSRTRAAAEKPRFLCLWFSQPAFDAQSVMKVTLLNEVGQPLETPTHDFATGVSPASAENWNLGWITASLCAGRIGQTPPKVTVRLEYSAGAWQFWDELPVNFHGSMALSNGVLVADPAQGADGKAFVQVTRDHAQDPGNEQFDFVAITKDGRRLNRVGLAQGATGNVVTERTIFDAPLDQIAKFECRKRPIQTATWDVPLLREPDVSAFGPAVERTMGNESVIDFETGKVIAGLPFAVTNEDDIAKALLNALDWMRREGLDAMYDTGGWFSTKGLKCVDMKTAPLEDDAWDRLTPEQLPAVLAGAKAEDWGSLDCQDKLPKTYAFQTRAGAVGILRLIGTTEDPQSVKLRYKLVRSASKE